MRVRRLAAGAVLAAAAAGVGGCSAADGPLRGSPPGESVGIINREPERSPTWHQGSFAVCLEDDDGPVIIEAIDPVLVGGARLVAAGAKRMTSWSAGTGPGPFPGAYAPAAGYEVTTRCSAQQWVELILEVAVPDAGSGGVDGFTVRYSRGDEHYEAFYAAQILFCRGTDTSADPEALADCADDPGP